MSQSVVKAAIKTAALCFRSADSIFLKVHPNFPFKKATILKTNCIPIGYDVLDYTNNVFPV